MVWPDHLGLRDVPCRDRGQQVVQIHQEFASAASAESFDIRHGHIAPRICAFLGGRGCLQPGSRSDKKSFTPRLGCTPAGRAFSFKQGRLMGSRQTRYFLRLRRPGCKQPRPLGEGFRKRLWGEPRIWNRPNPRGVLVLAGCTHLITTGPPALRSSATFHRGNEPNPQPRRRERTRRPDSTKTSEFRGSLLTFERKTLLYPLSPVTTGDDNESPDWDATYASPAQMVRWPRSCRPA